MPLKTFNNLTKERQNEILNVCFEEFSQYDYESASLGRIIKKLGLAKGSFYRYFENKLSLYEHLCKISIEFILNAYNEHFTDKHKDFFEAWIDFALATVQWEKEYPLYLRFLRKARSDSKVREIGLASFRTLESRIARAREQIQLHQKRGELRDDIDIDMMSIFVIQVREAIRQYFQYKHKSDDGDLTSFSSGKKKEIKDEITSFIRLMKEGIAKNTHQKNDHKEV